MEAETKDLYDRPYVSFVDLLLAVTDGSEVANLTCRRLAGIARSQGGPRVGIVLNKARPVASAIGLAALPDLDGVVLGEVPFDDRVGRADLLGLAMADYAPRCPAMKAIENLAIALREQCERVRA
jgi:CO dehydrogenase nickel-insertion accessory protein CooC1